MDTVRFQAPGTGVRGKRPEAPAYTKLEGNMKKAFDVITDEMKQKGDENLVQHGNFKQSYGQAADELKRTTDFKATDFNGKVTKQILSDLSSLTKDVTPKEIAPAMKDMLEICANVLAQNAELNKFKGPLFKLLLQQMKKQPNDIMYERGKIKRTNGQAAKELDKAKGLESDHYEPPLADFIFSNMKRLVSASTPKEMKKDMDETLDHCSKYLAQKALDDSERGPAFDLLIKELEAQGDAPFTDYPPLKTAHAVAYTLKSAPGLGRVAPDPGTVKEYNAKLHKVVDPVTPPAMNADMKRITELCSNYLSGFMRDRGPALALLLDTMKTNPTNVLVEREGYLMDNLTAASEVENAPILVPYLPVKDITADAQETLTKQMEPVTPSLLKLTMETLIKDVAKHLSQIVALRSGAAGERFKNGFLATVHKSMGQKPLYKYKSYGETYGDAADKVQIAETTTIKDLPKEAVNLGETIQSEMKRGLPTKLAPTVMKDMIPSMDVAAAHIAKTGTERGDAIDYVVNLMKDNEDEHLANLQGYDQSYGDAARRIQNSPTIRNDTIDIGAVTTVKEKLTTLTNENPDEKYQKVLPEIIDDTANFLAKPVPETHAEKKQVLADLMGREGDRIIAEKAGYKQTYQEAGEDIKQAPVGVTHAHDEEKKQHMVKQMQIVLPDEKMEKLLKDQTNEGAAYLADAVEGRGQALEIIQKSLKEEGSKEFINVGKFNKNYAQVGAMMADASNLKGDNPSPVIAEHVEHRFNVISKEAPKDKPLAQKHMEGMTDITSKYVATKATEECGLDAAQLAELDAQGFNAEAKAAAEARRLAAIEATTGEELDLTGPPGETREQRRLRYEAMDAAAKAERLRRRKEKEERLAAAAEAERMRRANGKYQGGALGADYDPEHTAALDILHEQLQAHGNEVLCEVAPTVLTHKTASQWLADPNPVQVDNSVKDSPDTAHLHKKFERKFSAIVKENTPQELTDAMQDVVIEGGRKTAEYFVTENYKSIVNDSLISEMQKRGDEVLVDAEGGKETLFFAAQRLKRKQTQDGTAPNYKIVPDIAKKLDDVGRGRAMPRKVNKTMKEHVKETSKFLSSVVNKPDEYIEAYVAMLNQLDAADDILLIEGDVPKTCKESADYLRQPTTFKDTIGLPSKPLQATIEKKLKAMMYHAPPCDKKPKPAVLDSVITDAATLLVSFVRLQAEKQRALNVLVKEMNEAGEGPLLRHGHLRKSYKDAAHELKGKTVDEFDVPNADPVVTRKVQIKLTGLMQDNTPTEFEKLMPGIIEDSTKYLAVRLLEPRMIKVCKCFKNVFVQCELWCDEILRRVARPCCTCSRHVSVQALKDLLPGDFLEVNEDQTHVLAPGVDISLNPCPNQARTRGPNAVPYCPAHHATTTSYYVHSTTHKQLPYCDPMQPSPSSTRFDFDSLHPSPSTSSSPFSPSPLSLTQRFSPLKSLLLEMHDDNAQFIRRQQEELQSYEARNQDRLLEMSPPSYSSASSSYNYRTKQKPSREQAQQFSKPISESCCIAPSKSQKYSSRTPIITSEHNAIDWDSTMVSLLWNVMAWRDWIQEIVDHALAYQYNPNFSRGDTPVSWASFYRRVTTEALQWRQYNVFSRQLTTSLHLRYRDKEIASPVRSNVNTKTYLECQKAMLDIIDMFNRWTQWLALVVKETDSLQQNLGSEIPLYVIRWNHLKKKVDGYSKDWQNYLKFLKVSWERKYKAVIADYLPSLENRGPVWVVSDSGAVPSGAVAAGLYDNEVIWVARALHRCTMLPATLLPSKHCCLVFADGKVHSYSKYQVMCNAEVQWVAWRGGSIHERAVSVAPGTYVGRVHYNSDHLLGAVHEPNYHCCVVIFGRPFSFNCYELLMLACDGDQ